jgi:uncharacterized protein YuzE
VIEKAITLTYDRDADAAYIYLSKPEQERVVARSRVCDIELEKAAITVDFDANGSVVGFEILGASRVLPMLFDD